jgi:hypothetical protein
MPGVGAYLILLTAGQPEIPSKPDMHVNGNTAAASLIAGQLQQRQQAYAMHLVSARQVVLAAACVWSTHQPAGVLVADQPQEPQHAYAIHVLSTWCQPSMPKHTSDTPRSCALLVAATPKSTSMLCHAPCVHLVPAAHPSILQTYRHYAPHSWPNATRFRRARRAPAPPACCQPARQPAAGQHAWCLNTPHSCAQLVDEHVKEPQHAYAMHLVCTRCQPRPSIPGTYTAASHSCAFTSLPTSPKSPSTSSLLPASHAPQQYIRLTVNTLPSWPNATHCRRARIARTSSLLPASQPAAAG